MRAQKGCPFLSVMKESMKTECEDPKEAKETTRQTCNSHVFLPYENVPDQYSKC